MFKIDEKRTDDNNSELAKIIASKMEKGYAYNARDIQKWFVDETGFPIYSEMQIHRIMSYSLTRNQELFLDVGAFMDISLSRVHYMLAQNNFKEEEEDFDCSALFEEDEDEDD